MGNERGEKESLKTVKRLDSQKNKQSHAGINAEQPTQSYMEYTALKRQRHPSEKLTSDVCGCDVESNCPVMEAGVVY